MGDGAAATATFVPAAVVFGTAGMLGVIGLLVWAAMRPDRQPAGAATALEIAGRCYARGDIGPEEYGRLRDDLLGQERAWRQLASVPSAPAGRVRGFAAVAASLALADGLLHLLAAPDHLGEWWGSGYFFIVVAIGQVLFALLLFSEPRRGRTFYLVGLVGTLAIVVLYVVTRTVGIPWLGPGAGEVEPVGLLDVPTKATELLLAGALLALLRETDGEAAPQDRAPTGAPDAVAGAGAPAGPRLSRRHALAALAGAAGLVGLGAAFAWSRREGDSRPIRGSVAGMSRQPPRSAGDARAVGPAPGVGAQPSPPSSPDGAVEVSLSVDEVPWELAPGRRVAALADNGQVPGPAIRVREGQRLRVSVTNRLATPTTIHWHGVDVPNAMDGVPDLTQPPIRPGSTFLYEFDARPSGTRWYHTHFDATHQQDRGLYAPLIILPAQEPNPPDREYTLVFSSWVTGQAAPAPAPGGMMGNGMMGNGMMGGGMMGSSGPAYDTLAVNGKAFPATAPLAVSQGERVRLRLINASGERTHLIALEGHRLRVTHTDGNALQQPVEVDVVPIAPAERYDVEFTADRPGVWSLHDLTPGQTKAGLRVRVVYAGHEGEPEAAPRTDAAGLELWSYALGSGVDRLGRATDATRDYALQLSGGMMGSATWTINGKVYPATDPLLVRQGDLVRVGLFNMSMQDHPIHLHGHSFRLTQIGGQTLAAPLIKDVVDVRPMERASLEFVADNPGNWMLHCHKPMHMDGGMATLVRYQAT